MIYTSPGRILPPSVDLGIAKVHLGVLRLELFEDIRLLLFLRRGQTLLLLPLVEHHLLDHAARLPVEVRELRILWLDLGDVDLGGVLDDVRPPLHLVYLVEVDFDRFSAVGIRRQGPSRVPGVDIMRCLALLDEAD